MFSPTSFEVRFDSLAFGAQPPTALRESLQREAPSRLRRAFIERGDGGLDIVNLAPALQVIASYVGVKLADAIASDLVDAAYRKVRAALQELWQEAPNQYKGAALELAIDLDDVKVFIAVHPAAGEGMGAHVAQEIKRVLESGGLSDANVIKVPMHFDADSGTWEHYLSEEEPLSTRYWGIGSGPDINYDYVEAIYDSKEMLYVAGSPPSAMLSDFPQVDL